MFLVLFCWSFCFFSILMICLVVSVFLFVLFVVVFQLNIWEDMKGLGPFAINQCLFFKHLKHGVVKKTNET